MLWEYNTEVRAVCWHSTIFQDITQPCSVVFPFLASGCDHGLSRIWDGKGNDVSCYSFSLVFPPVLLQVGWPLPFISVTLCEIVWAFLHISVWVLRSVCKCVFTRGNASVTGHKNRSQRLFVSLLASAVWVVLSAILPLECVVPLKLTSFPPLQDSEENRGDYLTRTLQVTYKNVSTLFWANSHQQQHTNVSNLFWLMMTSKVLESVFAFQLHTVFIFSSVAGLWNSFITSRGRTTAFRNPSLPSCKCWRRCGPTKPGRTPPSASTAGLNLFRNLFILSR